MTVQREPEDAGRGRFAVVLAALLALLLLVELVALVPGWLNSAPGGDEALFGYIGHFWGQGDFLPYRDAFENKPPAIFWVYRELMGSGKTMFTGPRIAATVSELVCALLVGLFAGLIAGRRIGAVFGLLAACLLLRKGLHGGLADTEAFMLPWVAAGMLLTWLSVTARRTWPCAIAGLCFGLAFLFKPVAAAEIVAAGLCLLWFRRGWAILALGAGVIVPIALSLAWAAGQGILSEYVDVAFVSLVGSETHPSRLGDIWRSVNDQFIPYFRGDGLPLLALMLFGLLSGWQREHLKDPALLLGRAWAVLTFLAMCSSGWFWEHQYKPVVPAALLLGAVALSGADWSRLHLRRLVQCATLAYALLLFWEPMHTMVMSRQAPRDWTANYRPMVEYVQANTEPQDTIYVMGLRSEIYVMAQRKASTRFFNSVFTAHHAEEFLREVETAAPRVMVADELGRNCLSGERASVLAPLLEGEYDAVTAFEKDGWLVYRHRRDARTPTPHTAG